MDPSLSAALLHPPSDLAERSLPLAEFAIGEALYRIHKWSHEPVWYGPGSGKPPLYRFDDPRRTYGVCYLGLQGLAAFVETFGRDLATIVIAEDDLARRAISRLTVTRALRLVMLHGPGLQHVGATSAVSGGKLVGSSAPVAGAYAHAQAWSRALHDHPEQPDGLIYRASHDDDLRCVALFEDRVGAALVPVARPRRLDRAKALLGQAVHRYPVVLVPSIPGMTG